MAMSSSLDSMSKYKELLAKLKGQVVVVASKYFEVSYMETLYEEGARDFGENKTNELLKKKALFTHDDITWHFIGSLQTNKVKQVINEIDYLHSLDRLSLAKSIQQHRINPLPCFIQLNIAEEPQKSGIILSELKQFMDSLRKYDKIIVVGFMAMGVFNDLEKTKAIFQTMKSLKNGYKLSMGMSDDYHLALKYDTDYIRIGSKLKE